MGRGGGRIKGTAGAKDGAKAGGGYEAPMGARVRQREKLPPHPTHPPPDCHALVSAVLSCCCTGAARPCTEGVWAQAMDYVSGLRPQTPSS